MQTINRYLIIPATLAMVFCSSISIDAAEEVKTIMCNGGIVNVGDTTYDVEDKCGQPNSRDRSQWFYEFGPSQPAYLVIFNEGKVVQIMEEK